MAKGSDNPFPSVLIAEGTEPSAPAAGQQRVYIDSTSHLLKRTDSSAVDVTIEPTPSTAWTPALTASSSNPTLGSGSAVEGHYIQIGKLVHAWCSVTFGSSGVAAGSGEYRISLPVTAVSTSPRVMGSVAIYDSSANRFFIALAYFSSTTVFRIAIGEAAGQILMDNTLPMVSAASDAIIANIAYEAA